MKILCEFCNQPIDGTEPWGCVFKPHHMRCLQEQPEHVRERLQKRIQEIEVETGRKWGKQ